MSTVVSTTLPVVPNFGGTYSHIIFYVPSLSAYFYSYSPTANNKVYMWSGLYEYNHNAVFYRFDGSDWVLISDSCRNIDVACEVVASDCIIYDAMDASTVYREASHVEEYFENPVVIGTTYSNNDMFGVLSETLVLIPALLVVIVSIIGVRKAVSFISHRLRGC